MAESASSGVRTSPGNRLAWLDGDEAWFPGVDFPKLVTPQWVGEPGVECVVVLAIDDMREPAKYEAYLRPILERLKQIDGRAGLSIMTCNVDPEDPRLAEWVKEGVSLEVHTIDHPCPLLAGGDFAKAKSTFDRCVDLMHRIPGNKPVAFRMPCCDSLNTVSPRFYAEIFNKLTPGGHHLEISSSVFNVFTSSDPEIPRELVLDAEGRDRFLKYIPKGLARDGKTFDTFVNTIENYPYPYIVNRFCWEFPCVVPSDWSAQHLHRPFNPVTVEDLKAALDIAVVKQGVFNLVFHPHGWIRNDQIVELIDHAVARHGQKVKFLSFQEAHQRLARTLLHNASLRAARDGVGVARLFDVNDDGYMDVVVSAHDVALARIWSARDLQWVETPFPALKSQVPPDGFFEPVAGVVAAPDRPSLLCGAGKSPVVLTFDGSRWGPDTELSRLGALPLGDVPPHARHNGFRFRDLDADGRCELVFAPAGTSSIFRWHAGERAWHRLPFALPKGVSLADSAGRDAGLRFVDLDEDGHLDLVFSNATRYGVYLFENMEQGFSRVLLEGRRGQRPPGQELPPIVLADGTCNGFFVHSRHLFWQNEQTDKLLDLVDRRSFNELLALDPALPRPKSPRASLDAIRTRPGLVVELVASEPLTMDPVAFAWGPDGKFWIAEMGDYPLASDGQNAPSGGRVRFLEDTDGDGRFDRSTVFLEVAYPTGVLPWNNGVLVTAAPHLLFAQDTDGDGRADRREILYTGFVEGNQQHRVNGLVWGLDNWIHLANGDSGGVIRSVKTGQQVRISGRDLRVRPATGQLDAEAGQSQFGRNQDDWGNWFGCNNANPMYQFVLEDRYQRRNPHFPPPEARVNVSVAPGTAPVFPQSRLLERFNDLHTANRFTSACSAIVYRDELLGPAFAGNAFISEPVHNLVHREIMRASGAVFSSRRAPDELQSEFLASSDNWFRPTMIKTGPDGALWIADMYRGVIEHPQWIPDTFQKRLDLRAGHTMGRIYRVYPVASTPRQVPRLDQLSSAALVAQLDSQSGTLRDMCQQLLVERQDRAAHAVLRNLAAQSASPLARLHALCTLEGTNGLTPEILQRALADPHPGVRRQAVRLCEALPAPAPLVDNLARLVDDDDAFVRLQLACTLGAIDDRRAGQALGRLLVRWGQDRFLFAAAMSSINRANVGAVLYAVLAARGTEPPNANLVENLLHLAAAFNDEGALATLLADVAADNAGRYEAWQFAAAAGLLDALARQRRPLAALARSPDSRLRESAAGLDRLFAAARDAAADARLPPAARLAAIRVLGRGSGPVENDLRVLEDLLSPKSEPELQEAAIAALGRLDDARPARILIAAFRGLAPGRRGQALDLLLSRAAWQDSLLDALEKQTLAPADLDAARQARLLNHESREFQQRASRALAVSIERSRRQVVEKYLPALDLAADPRRGAALFDQHCAQCHRLQDRGHEVGPDLGALADKSAEALLVAILDPNRAVESRYLAYAAQTTGGQVFAGMLASETGSSITLRGTEGREQTILRVDLEELTGLERSLMPEGLEAALTPQHLADLIAYIRQNVPLARRKEFAGNNPALVRPNADGSLVLLPSTCEIYGSTLVLEEQYGNLGYWSSLDDLAVWQIEAPAGRYRIELDYACDESCAGNAWRIETPAASATGEVKSTGTWDNYRKAVVGELELASGRQRLAMRPAARVQGAMIDLRAVRLLPVGRP